MPHHISRADYAGMFGPTAGDRIRLADTDLIVAVEHDFTVYGEEAKFGAGRMIRDGMGQSQASRAEAAADTVITNALIIDHWGIVKADIGLRDGRIAGIGKAGNPDIQPGVDIVVGPGTEVIAGEGRIVTAGAVDTHVPLVTPRQVEAALAAGITTMVGGGTGPATGSRATGCTPGPWHLDRMIRASEAFPMNLAFAGKGNASLPAALEEQVRAGAAALDLDADWGIGPAAIDCCLAIADEFDVQVSIRADARNESGFVEDTMAAVGGRTIRAMLAGGAPELARLLALANVLPASGQSSVGGPESIAAEDILHDTGAISMMASGGWAPGRAGDMLIRTWQAAHRMKLQRGSLPEDADGRSDNFRVKRYVAKYTINPAIAHGLDEWVGSVTIGKLADLVVWTPAFFGVKPELVIKMGSIAAAPADPSGEYRPMFGAFGKATTHSAVTFVSQAAAADGLAEVLGMERRLVPVRHTRGITKESMIHNTAMPTIEIDPETGAIRVDGEVLASAPAETLPLAQRYFLF